MKEHAGTPDELREAIFACKEARRRADAAASPEEKLEMLEAMQELAEEFRRARGTARPGAGAEAEGSKGA